MKRITWLLWIVLLPMLLRAPDAEAMKDVDVALVLVSDVSRSIDDVEYKLQKEGYAAAFTDPRVVAAIRGGPNGAIAVAYVEFASAFEVRNVIEWTELNDLASAQAFAERLAAAPRSFWGRTAIGTGIDRGAQLLAESGYSALRRVIDVCADGTSNAGREVTAARDDAIRAGITVNALVIITENPAAWAIAHVQPPGGLPNYFRENVTGGPGSFVLEVNDFAKFGEAMTRKLVMEIAGAPPAARFATGNASP